MTARDSVSVLDSSSGVKSVRRDAVGAEIPVTVHASRTTQGLGKNLPAVHEETKTVIVLQQGAVVRLTANLMTGETVVLTNRMTGADVLCRVGKIKSQPGIQHYVDLEFMQRAPNFWGDALAAVSVPSLEPPAPATARIAAPVAVAPPPPASIAPAPAAPPMPHAVLSHAPESAPVPAPSPAEPLAVASQPVPNSAVAERVLLQPPSLPMQPAESPIYGTAEMLQAVPLAEPVSPSRMGSSASATTPIAAGLGNPSFGAIRAESVTVRSHSKFMVAAAAIVLVLGGSGGYWLYSSRQTTSAAAPAMQPVPTVTPAPTAPDLTPASTLVPDSDLNPPPASVELSTLSSTPKTDIVVATEPPVEPPARRVQPAVRTSEPPLRRNNVPIGKLQAPKAKTTVANVDASMPPPAILGAVNLSDGGATSALLASEPTGPAPPPIVGGQLQQPQLISSTAAVYPSNARMQRIQGTVVLDALVDENGRVVETEVITGPQPLALAAQDAVRNWKYKPAQLNGRPIAVHTKVSVRFNLQ